jgi:type II secretory ATPase GspE/PulE/Tfp pilus assembly ATPase PilB-like protein
VELDDVTIESLAKLFHLEKLIPVLVREGVIPAKSKSFKDLEFFKGQGCDKCNHSGYKGRMGIHEILEVTPSIGDMIMQHKSAQEIEGQAEKDGMVLMWEDGFIKAIKGITTVEEILRVSKE